MPLTAKTRPKHHSYSLIICLSFVFLVWLVFCWGFLHSGHIFLNDRSCYSPFDAGDEKDEIAVDFGAVDELVYVAGVHGLSRLEDARPDAVAH